jgi:hypothetical protein
MKEHNQSYNLLYINNKHSWRSMIRSSKWKPTKKKLQRPVRPEGEHRRCWATSRGKIKQRVVEGMKMEKRERKEWKRVGFIACLNPRPPPSRMEGSAAALLREARAHRHHRAARDGWRLRAINVPFLIFCCIQSLLLVFWCLCWQLYSWLLMSCSLFVWL